MLFSCVFCASQINSVLQQKQQCLEQRPSPTQAEALPCRPPHRPPASHRVPQARCPSAEASQCPRCPPVCRACRCRPCLAEAVRRRLECPECRLCRLEEECRYVSLSIWFLFSLFSWFSCFGVDSDALFRFCIRRCLHSRQARPERRRWLAEEDRLHNFHEFAQLLNFAHSTESTRANRQAVLCLRCSVNCCLAGSPFSNSTIQLSKHTHTRSLGLHLRCIDVTRV